MVVRGGRGVRAGRRAAVDVCAWRVHQQSNFRGTPTPQVRASSHTGVCRGEKRHAVAKIALPYYLTAGGVPPAPQRVYIGTDEEHTFVNTSTNV